MRRSVVAVLIALIALIAVLAAPAGASAASCTERTDAVGMTFKLCAGDFTAAAGEQFSGKVGTISWAFGPNALTFQRQVTIAWGDGETSTVTSALDGSIYGAHTYGTDEDRMVTLTYDHVDLIGGKTTITATAQATVEPEGTEIALPCAAVTGSTVTTTVCAETFSATAGLPFNGPVGTFSLAPPSPGASPAGSILIDWGDGTAPSPGTATSDGKITGSHTYTTTGAKTVKVTYAEAGGAPGSVTATGTATVSAPPVATQQCGTATQVHLGVTFVLTTCGRDITANAGEQFSGLVATHTATFNGMPIAATPVGAVIDWGDGTPPSTGTATPDGKIVGTHTFADDTDRAVSVTFVGTLAGAVLSSSGLTQATVNPAGTPPPRCESGLHGGVTREVCGVDFTPVKGKRYKGPVGTFTPPPAAGELRSVVIDWGDGTPPEGGTVIGEEIRGDHTYAIDGEFTVTMTGTSGLGGGQDLVGRAKATVRADGVPPPLPACDPVTLFNVTAEVCAADVHVGEGMAFSGKVATFALTGADAAASQRQSATIDWGDGTPAEPGTLVGDEIHGSHTYAQPGFYQVEVQGIATEPVTSSVLTSFGNATARVATRPTCGGLPATIFPGSGHPGTVVAVGQPMVVTGTTGDDVIAGSAAADRIKGGGGDDVICAGDGADVLYDEQGADEVHGGGDDDVFVAGRENDDFHGGDGDDRVSYATRTARVTATVGAASGNGVAGESDAIAGDVERLTGGAVGDVLTGDAGANRLEGLGGKDELRGGDGADTLLGGSGGDTLLGEAGPDRLEDGSGDDDAAGGANDDVLVAGSGQDDLAGGTGADRVSYALRSAGVKAAIGTPAGNGAAGEDDAIGADVEGLSGGSGDDELTGASGPNGLYGNGGIDTLSGAGGADRLYGGSGGDLLTDGTGKDLLYGQADADQLTLTADGAADRAACGDGADTVSALLEPADTADADCEAVG